MNVTYFSCTSCLAYPILAFTHFLIANAANKYIMYHLHTIELHFCKLYAYLVWEKINNLVCKYYANFRLLKKEDENEMAYIFKR